MYSLRNINYAFCADVFEDSSATKETIRASLLAMENMSSFIKARTLSRKLFFTSLVDNAVVDYSSLASCCTVDHWGRGGGALRTDRRGNIVDASRALKP